MSSWERRGKSDNWYTPKFVFEALGCEFDVDVAGKASVPHSCVPTGATIETASLLTSWSGFVWMNPPFGGRNGVMPWAGKFFAHSNGIALTPDRTSAPWFRYCWEHADLVLFTPKIQFLREDGTPGTQPSNGTALWASGPQGCAALNRAARAGLGVIGMPLRGRERAA